MIRTALILILSLLSFARLSLAGENDICKAAGLIWPFKTGSYNIGACRTDIHTKPSNKIVVGVVDTGIDDRHPQIKNHLWSNPKKLSEFGYDTVNNHSNPYDYSGHGTHVSGIILSTLAATLGEKHRVVLMPVSYCCYKYGQIERQAPLFEIAIRYAIDHGARIINISGGGEAFSQQEFDTLKLAEEKGILVVAAAGNNGQEIGVLKQTYYPGGYKLKNIISVANLNRYGELEMSSNYGKNISLAAPGTDILSWQLGEQSQRISLTGTSQATAFVSGVAAALMSQYPEMGAVEIKQIILDSVKKIPNLRGKVASRGIVNFEQAMKLIEQRAAKNSTQQAREIGGAKNR